MGLCSVEGCGRSHCARGYCNTHYAQWRRHGDALFVKPERRCSVPGCQDKHYARGYCHRCWKRWRTHGDPTIGRQQEGVRNPAWKGNAVSYRGLHTWVRRNFADGPCEHCGVSQPGMEWAQKHGREGSRTRADWLRLCVPCHRAYDDNGWWNRKTHCKHGHPFDEENTYWNRGKRGCRACIQARNRRKAANAPKLGRSLNALEVCLKSV